MSSESSESSDEVTFKFLRPESVVVKPVTCCWVYNTDGGLLVDLCYDRPRRTLAVTHKLGPDKVLGAQTNQQVAAEVLREVMASVEMSPQTALAIGKYLVEAAKSRGVVDAPGDAAAPPESVH